MQIFCVIYIWTKGDATKNHLCISLCFKNTTDCVRTTADVYCLLETLFGIGAAQIKLNVIDVKPELNFHDLNDLTSFGPNVVENPKETKK